MDGQERNLQLQGSVSSLVLKHSGLAHLQPWPTWSALVCYPGRVQGPLSCVLQLVRARNSSFTLMTFGSALSSAAGIEGYMSWVVLKAFFLHSCHHMADEGIRVYSHALRAGSLASPQQGQL